MLLRIILAGMLMISGGAKAELNVTDIAQLADAYKKFIQSSPGTLSAVQLLRSIKTARDNKKIYELIQLSEHLVALNPQSFSSWLQLGNAHRSTDARSEKALAAGYQAYTVTRVTSEQVEALLLISSVLRTQLKHQSDSYLNARADIEAASRQLQNLNDTAASSGSDLNRTSPAGNWRILDDARARASIDAETASGRIQSLSITLDAIYSEVASKLPNLSIAKMKAGDARSSVFNLIQNSESSENSARFAARDALIQACFDFSHELKPNGLSYLEAVTLSTVSDEDEQIATKGFGTETNGRTLCLTSLLAAKKYSVIFTEKLESKAGANLKEAVTQEFTTPDLPRQVSFSGRNFILPQNGGGQIPLRVTNVAKFGLEIYRITDRTLHRHVALGHIGGMLPESEYNDLRSKFAERLWSATIVTVDDEQKRNKPFRAFLPVRDILSARMTDIEAKIKSIGAGQGEIAFFPQQQVLENDGGRQVSLQDARFEADVAAFALAAGKHPTAGVYALVVKNLNEVAADRKADSKCSNECGTYLVQWFVDSDTGLAFYEGDSDFTVVARSLKSGEAKEKTRIELVSAGNRVLDFKLADSNGVARFSKSITQGTQSNKLIAILAGSEGSSDFSFLTFSKERLDLSRLNVDGRPVSNGLAAFVTTDRGIYQSGDVIHALTMIRNGDGELPQALPKIVVRLESRDRILDLRRIDPSQLRLGGTDLSLNVPMAARAGPARITVSSGEAENAPVIGEVNIQLGQVRADRARLDFVESSWTVKKSASDMVDLAGTAKARYLFGDEQNKTGTASNLKAEVLVKLQAAEGPSSCDNAFSFGRFDDNSATVSTRQFFQVTDPNGELELDLRRVAVPTGTRPISAVVEITLFDSSGPLASRSMVFPVSDSAGWIGLSKVPQIRSTADGYFKLSAELMFAGTTDNVADKRQLSFKLERENEHYAWIQSDGVWRHVKSSPRDAVTVTGNIRDVTFPGRGTSCANIANVPDLADRLSSGRYVLTVTDVQTNRQTSVRFQTGSALTDPDQLEPNIFSLSTDKPTYRPGETIEVTANVPFHGPILIAVADTDIRQWIPEATKGNFARIKVKADPAWSGKQLYFLATAYRATGNDPKIGPARAIGVTSFSVDGSQSAYAVSIRPLNAATNSVQPDAPLSFEICISERSGGKCLDNAPEDAFAVAYVVDEGLLGLTSHLSSMPKPETHFFGRKRLGVKIMDNYDRLLLREGGDRPTRLALSNYTSNKIFAVGCGVAKDNLTEPLKMQRGRVTCTIPKIGLNDGAVSIYAAVWSAKYSAAASKTVAVRSRVVADLGSPSFLYGGDQAVLPLRLENIDFVHNGDYLVRVDASGPVKTIGLAATGTSANSTATQAQFRTQLLQGHPKTAYLNLETIQGAKGDIDLRISVEAIASSAPLDQSPRVWSIKVRSPTLSTSETVSFSLRQPPIDLGDKLKSIASKYDLSTIRVTAKFSDNAQQLLSSTWSTVLQEPVLPVLDQLVWRAMLLLNSQADQKTEITRLVNEIQSLQLANGSFVPYRAVGNHSEAELNFVNTSDDPDAKRQATAYRTASVLDVLIMASKAGIEVSGKAMTSGSRFLKNAVDTTGTSDEQRCSFDTAYALRVLVALGVADQDNLDVLKRCQQDTDNPARAAAAGAAFQRFGLPHEAKVSMASLADDKDPARFKDLSDYRLAMMLVMLKEANAPSDLIGTVAQSLVTASMQSNLSPAAGAWIARAQHAQGSQPTPLSISDFVLNGTTPTAIRQTPGGAFELGPFSYDSLQNSPISIGQKTNRAVTAYVTIEGMPKTLDSARRIPDGSLKRRFFNSTTGQEIDLAKTPLELGSRIVVVLEGTEDAVPVQLDADGNPTDSGGSPLVIADLLPSAFEIISNNVTLPGKTQDPSRHLDALTTRGDLRTVYTDTGRWIALVTPEPAEEKDKNTMQMVSSDDLAKIRRAYMVRVNLAGRFILPSLSIERSEPPIKTRHSSSSTFQVRQFDGSPR